MDINVVRIAEKQYLAGVPGKKLIQTEDDITRILELCYENDTNRVLLYAENFSDNFFDLSSGEAGMILQKFSNYFVKGCRSCNDWTKYHTATGSRSWWLK